MSDQCLWNGLSSLPQESSATSRTHVLRSGVHGCAFCSGLHFASSIAMTSILLSRSREGFERHVPRVAPTLRAGAKGPPKKGQEATRFWVQSGGVTVLRGRRAPMPHQLDFRLLGHWSRRLPARTAPRTRDLRPLATPQNGRGRWASALSELRDARLTSRPVGTRRLRVTRTR